jgi:hypothetical protein
MKNVMVGNKNIQCAREKEFKMSWHKYFEISTLPHPTKKEPLHTIGGISIGGDIKENALDIP